MMGDPGIILLSSLNVGSRNRISNAELRDALWQIGLSGAHPVMQSGNLVINDVSRQPDCRKLEQTLEQGLKSLVGLDTSAFVYRASTLRHITSEPPWPAQPSKVLLFVHRSTIGDQELANLKQALKSTEQLSLGERYFWLHAPEGIAGSRIAAKASSLIGAPATARSLSSLSKILSAVDQKSSPPAPD
jgi:uncharacterized protein (DUF1697 family)